MTAPKILCLIEKRLNNIYEFADLRLGSNFSINAGEKEDME
jgi:hypothetical protein